MRKWTNRMQEASPIVNTGLLLIKQQLCDENMRSSLLFTTFINHAYIVLYIIPSGFIKSETKKNK